MTSAEAAANFIRDAEHKMLLQWWTSIRLSDCGVLVYKHGVIDCACGRTQFEAYEAWRKQNPVEAREHDLIRESKQ